MKTQNLSTLQIHKLTQDQYDRELEAGRIDENALYLTPDEENEIGFTSSLTSGTKIGTLIINGVATDLYCEPKTEIDIDTALSGTSTNPVQNKVVNEAISNLNTLVGNTAVATQIENAIDALNLSNTYAPYVHDHNDIYYTKTQIDNIELITVEDIDAICGASIQAAGLSEVTF